jgi:iron complex transport system ATP-binding protein
VATAREAPEIGSLSGVAEVPGPVIRFSGVGVRREGRWILDDVDWTVRTGERWAIVGPNGSGKTTLLRIASTYLWPSHGTVTVLGATIGRVDVRELRRRIGFVSAAIAAEVDGSLVARDAVMSARHAALAPWWAAYTRDDADRAEAALDRLGVGGLGGRTFATLSSGERQRVLIARTLIAEPELLLLDEPAAGLDLGAREALVARMTSLAADPAIGAIVLVTHHPEEIPAGFTHALILVGGRVAASGPIGATLTGETLSLAYGLRLAVGAVDGRFWARADD